MCLITLYNSMKALLDESLGAIVLKGLLLDGTELSLRDYGDFCSVEEDT